MEREIFVPTKLGMEIVLNGGQPEMDSASIPIKWFFSDNTIKKNPRFIVVCEYNSREIQRENDDACGHYYRQGRRYVFKVTDGVRHIPAHTPGYHRIIVLAIAIGYYNQDIKGVKRRYLSYNDNLYNTSIPCELEEGVVAATIVDFYVPEELFAEKPKSILGKALWWWVNFCFKASPINQCRYRRRMLFAFLVQPIYWLFGGFFHALYVFLASIIVFFFGYRPKPILKETLKALLFQRYAEWEVRRYEEYRLWYDAWYDDRKRIDRKFMPITGCELTLIAGSIFVIIDAVLHLFHCHILSYILLAPFSCILIAVTLTLGKRFLISTKWGKSLREKLLKRKKARELADEMALKSVKDRYQQWLKEYLGSEKKPDVVDLTNLPPSFSKVMGGIRYFRVTYEILKAKVCKPYPK